MVHTHYIHHHRLDLLGSPSSYLQTLPEKSEHEIQEDVSESIRQEYLPHCAYLLGEGLRLVPARVLGKDLSAFSSVTQWNGSPTV